jgi:N-acetylmuramoyl-L-alanine amidase
LLYLRCRHGDLALLSGSNTTFKDVKTWTKGCVGGINFGYFSRAKTHPVNSYAVGQIMVNGRNIMWSTKGEEHFHAICKTDGKVRIQQYIPAGSEWGIRAGPRLIANGKLFTGEGGITDSKWVSGGIAPTSLVQRVAVGLTKSDVILAYWDKTTIRNMANDLLSLGVVDAVAGDGGSSASYVDYTTDTFRGWQYVPNALCVKVPYTKPIIERVDVVLDSGHGGKDPGAVFNGHFEKDFNLQSCRNMRRYLERAGYKVAMTREADCDTTLEGIVKFSNDRQPKVFYCKHHNSFKNDQAVGREYFTYPGSARGLKIAQYIESYVKLATEQHFRRMDQASFYTLRYTDAPAVYDEGGFLTNPGDLALLKDSSWMDKRDFAASLGIIKYLKEVG